MPMLNTKDKAAQLELLIGHVFNNKSLAAEAVQMAAPQIAIIHEGNFAALDNNKRLAVLGDAVLAKVLCEKWFKGRDSQDRVRSLADWTTVRNELTSNDALAGRGYNLGIDHCVIMGTGTHLVSPKMVATSIEAIIGAVYVDDGDDAVLHVIEQLGFFDHHYLQISVLDCKNVPLHVDRAGNKQIGRIYCNEIPVTTIAGTYRLIRA